MESKKLGAFWCKHKLEKKISRKIQKEKKKKINGYEKYDVVSMWNIFAVFDFV